jgi:predicted RNase H-like HicB family nuclease
MKVSIELDRENDGRWIAEALELPGVMSYGPTREEAISNTERLAIEVIADRITHGEMPASELNVSFEVGSGEVAENGVGGTAPCGHGSVSSCIPNRDPRKRSARFSRAIFIRT